MKLTQSIYALTKHFPDDERTVLTGTLKRMATSIPTKVAESHDQDDPAEAISALVAAQTTLRDVAAYLDVAERLRLTARRRFWRPRRRARKVAEKLADLTHTKMADDMPKSA